ncbi:MAG: phosphodiester glycosidase family protein [Cyclobacteriaceae bacterium]|jgi:uncharacterized protein YigE (DUF2233 family)|nr:phosphodiester glycosidase family protein [Flammeovirgaceae bacterium]
MHQSINRVGLLLLLIAGILSFTGFQSKPIETIVSYTVDPKKQHLKFFWKDDRGTFIKSLQNLKVYVEGKNAKLVFATNGGMFDSDGTPHGLFIQNKIKLTELDTASGQGNFYLKPNGVFYLTENHVPVICKTTEFKDHPSIQDATQSGPMLVADGQIHSAFKQGSTNVNIRNGVGILPDNNVVFAMSVNPINFYDFATYFQKLGCKNALYLDGVVSRTYWPEGNWIQTDGNFGVIIGVIDKPIEHYPSKGN